MRCKITHHCLNQHRMKARIKHSLTFFFLLGLLLQLGAQSPNMGTIRGQIVAADADQALEYATVSVFSAADILNNVPSVAVDMEGNINLRGSEGVQVLEYATGENFANFTRQHILLPLGMASSGWSYDKIDFDQHSTLYSDSITELPFYYLVTYPDGGMRTSSADFALYLQELIRGYAGKGTILSPEGYEAFYTQQMNDSQFEERDAEWTYNDEYDFGVFIGFAAETYIGHTGGDPGVASFMFFDKEKKIGRFLVINTDLNSQEGVDEFFGIWEKLKEYEDRL